MRKIYLKRDKSCFIDLDTGIIENEGVQTQLEPQIENFLMHMIEKTGVFCSYTELGEKLQDDPSFFPDKKYVTDKAKKLYEALRKPEIGIALSFNLEERNDADIVILNKSGNKGGYTLFLPNLKTSGNGLEENIKALTNLYWGRYENVSPQKDGENKNGAIVGKISDVFQQPVVDSQDNRYTWKVNDNDKYNQNILIEAPNGYGKTTFMRSIMLSASYTYMDCLTDKEIERYERIRLFHNIESDNFVLYLECKHMDLNTFKEQNSIEWIYKTLSNLESIRINHFIDIDAFASLLETFNEKQKLVLLIDGLDEMESKYRPLLISKINEFQTSEKFGRHSRIIVATRPLFWRIAFPGYKIFKISNRDIIENSTVLMNYIKTYKKRIKNYVGKKNFDANNIYEDIINNPYLRDLVCVPQVIIQYIYERQTSNEFYELVERIINEMMLRYDSQELTVYIEQYKKVYEALAFKYLCLTGGDSALPCYDNEALSLIRVCIDEVKGQGYKSFNKVFNESNISEEMLGELFLTNVSLIECMDRVIKFNSLTYAYHFAARYVLRCFVAYNNELDIYKILNIIPIKYRYYVMTIASTLVTHIPNDRYLEGYGDSAADIRFDLAPLFFEYFRDNWNSTKTELNEKMFIQDAIARMLLKYYGESVYTNPNICDEKYIQWFNGVLSTNLGQSYPSVSKYRDGKR
ncbi:hypothetical protein H6A03_07290 [[Clostridium] spiroforme]|nr:hypothetical protein [Thomasclavelia spiroformis]MBM6879546.1 hypothetical protein [Thomasclavelia spiroformis]